MKKLNTRFLKHFKRQQKGKSLQMLTCYDYQTASLLNTTDLDMILVGDSLGNVILGYETTIPVTLDEMIIFSRAVRKGAPDKFLIGDLPFGTYATFQDGLKNSIRYFQETGIESIKLEGDSIYHQELIQKLTENGMPVMGHIGLQAQSIHTQGGYYTHGKNKKSENELLEKALRIEDSGAYAILIEYVQEEVAKKITEKLTIPTIGIGSGHHVDGQVLVINDLLGMGPNPPHKHCTPLANLYAQKKQYIDQYLQQQRRIDQKNFEEPLQLH